MASDKGPPLPKFGEWDVNDPASAEGYTVIFNKARDEKKTKNDAPTKITSPRNDAGRKDDDSHQNPPKVHVLNEIEYAEEVELFIQLQYQVWRGKKNFSRK
ncbi:protein NOI4 isoform X2 [Manihot esculenta]|uniref:protein NOI4 isoform X2 n=1 Tax=Manihot esculenta TaxID=3983 RepID=UPI001CC77CBC|nr:protein NOI4 isoform X2 [Manihot esculenta]